MGKSPSIKELEAKEDEFRAYLAKLQGELEHKSAAAAKDVQDEIDKFYTDNKYTDAKDLVSGKNYDFMQQKEFSLENMKNIVDSISKAVFAGAPAPAGTEVSADGKKAAETTLGPEVGEMANLELYIAGQVFSVLSNVILSFGTSTSISFSTNLQSKPLGYGMQLFTAVSADSYESKSFFHNEYIYEYLYLYDVKFSVLQAKSEMNMTLVELYEDQIVVFKKMEEDLLKKLSAGQLTAEAYATANDAFDAQIAKVQAKVAALKSIAAAAAQE